MELQVNILQEEFYYWYYYFKPDFHKFKNQIKSNSNGYFCLPYCVTNVKIRALRFKTKKLNRTFKKAIVSNLLRILSEQYTVKISSSKKDKNRYFFCYFLYARDKRDNTIPCVSRMITVWSSIGNNVVWNSVTKFIVSLNSRWSFYLFFRIKKNSFHHWAFVLCPVKNVFKKEKFVLVELKNI